MLQRPARPSPCRASGRDAGGAADLRVRIGLDARSNGAGKRWGRCRPRTLRARPVERPNWQGGVAGAVGIEPTLPYENRFLTPARLPVPPHPHAATYCITKGIQRGARAPGRPRTSVRLPLWRGSVQRMGGMTTREVRSVGSKADRGNGDAMDVAVDDDGG
jgi:hypothetical protein